MCVEKQVCQEQFDELLLRAVCGRDERRNDGGHRVPLADVRRHCAVRRPDSDQSRGQRPQFGHHRGDSRQAIASQALREARQKTQESRAPTVPAEIRRSLGSQRIQQPKLSIHCGPLAKCSRRPYRPAKRRRSGQPGASVHRLVHDGQHDRKDAEAHGRSPNILLLQQGRPLWANA